MRYGISSKALGLLIVLGLGALPGQPSVAQEPLNIDAYQLTFEESFDSLDVSAWGEKTSRWIAHTPWNGDFGDARFTDPAPGFPFTTDQGILKIEARKEADGTWRSGLLSSVNPKGEGFSQQFGYFEARMKLPPGKGVWPAFWLIGLDRSKYTAEIDVLEYYGRAPYEFSMGFHIWRQSQGGQNSTGGYWQKVQDGILNSEYHTYGVDIQADKTSFYFDRKFIWSFDTPKEFHMPFYPLVNLALGSGWPIDETPNPSILLVDYIHVYQRKPTDAGN
ncbi:family 16 glycosylhydrolase [Rhizobium leguminosarum bv. viciae]|jgi:beta-glucanase (GH16 family)|uniref:Family 16 glycosylhydrolase n=1 Tax=Rhizobium leguminosarum bv. viciae TaxID=387 RepID=A0A4R0BJK7_RHILV|nr:glycoside hydrolase family 16 protein [Rhizobium leguminosarum]ASR09380.1 1,3-1,4-beta-glycanase [Rhizobium leguminosarum bv. viciae]MBY5781808.1 glycoside hydrolase family 16 protein [Rhizobium leguminosarum]MBY5786411.1 glycoside hydrolase family 16 protein [Rhizobium leguminosarum]MBY5789675.1 glycoside hydrolase family 16 protein [Rhizobium leguminosarum]MBY5824115.1 glycoside hydrolase family 16 protein [Rhizobium leguminosarum]